MGPADRIIRVITAAVFVALSFTGIVSGPLTIILPVAAAFLGTTAFSGHCPLYKLAGTSTDIEREQKIRRDGVN